MISRRLLLRHILVSVLFILLYVLLNRPEVIFISRIGFVAWYPAIGLVMALLLGVSPWYALLVCVADALAAKLIYAQPILSFSSTVGSMGSALCYGTAAYVLRESLHIDLGLRRRRDVVRYVLVCMIAAAGASVFGVGCLIADHSITWSEYKSSGVGWFLGDAIGLAGIAPFLLVHLLPRIRAWLAPVHASRSAAKANFEFDLRGVPEAVGQILTMLAVLYVMFGARDRHYDYFYLSFIPVIWIAMRQGIRRVVTGLLFMNFGIVVAMHLFPATTLVFTKVAVLMMVLSAVGLIVGSEVSERQRLALDLHSQSTYLDSLIQNSPLGIIVLDREGAVELANSAFERLFQCDRSELAAMVMPEAEGPGSIQLIRQVFAGNALRTTVRQRRKDGKILDLSVQGVPLSIEGEIRGAYLIYEDISEQARLNEAQRQHAESLDQLVRELGLRTQQTTALNEMGSLLACSGAVKEASGVVANSVSKLFPAASSGALYLFRPSRDLVEASARWGKKDGLAPAFAPDACWSLRRGLPHWSGHSENDIVCQHHSANSTGESLCLPMVAQGNTLGILHLQFEGSAEPANGSGAGSRDSRERLAVSAASNIALSLASLQLRETLREQSIRDPLTRLFNRRFLEESLARELRLSERNHLPVSLIFLDLDHFKRFNDTFGHDAGDKVLQSLADLFLRFFRATDICCRYGGEEFAIILPESSSRDAVVRADVLRAEVKSLRLEYKRQTLGPLSISVGVAAFPEHGSSSEELMKLADQSLYESKARGRDVVSLALAKNA
jgi:diguanylate cyclase (GGDEF)-like protein/PAS domain S-box-containing protein